VVNETLIHVIKRYSLPRLPFIHLASAYNIWRRRILLVLSAHLEDSNTKMISQRRLGVSTMERICTSAPRTEKKALILWGSSMHCMITGKCSVTPLPSVLLS
jgi:hypothetical protein